MRVGDIVEVINGSANGSGFLGERARITGITTNGRYSIRWLKEGLNPSSTVGWLQEDFNRYMRVIKKPLIIIEV